MKRGDCWMTFSEALENYISARELKRNSRSLQVHEMCDGQMAEAAAHMDALTALEEEDDH